MNKKTNELKAVISTNLQLLRIKKGWTQEYVGELMGNYYSYQRLEQGVTTLKIEDAITLGEIFGVPLESFFKQDSDEKTDKVSEGGKDYNLLNRRNSLQVSVLLDGSKLGLEKQIELLTKVNAALAE